MQKRLFISLVIGSSLSVVTLYLAFRNVPFDQLVEYLATINYWWLLPTIVALLSAFILRTLRWQVILHHIAPISFSAAFHPLMIGFMMNCVLPGRVGELARPIILKQKKGVSVTTGLATVAAERIFDIFTLILLFVLVLSTITSHSDLDGYYLGFHLNSNVLKSAAMGMVRLSIALAIGLGLLTIEATRRRIKTIIIRTGRWVTVKKPRTQRAVDGVTRFLTGIIDDFSIGLALLRNPGRFMACTGLTILIWLLTAFSYLIFAKGCPGIKLSFLELTTTMVVICFVIALPSVPGFWGVWEAGGVFALAIFSVPEKDALGFTLLNHAAQIFPVIIIGLISALITSVNFLQLTRKDAKAKEGRRPETEGV